MVNFKKSNNHFTRLSILLFILWPFLSFFNAFKNYKYSFSKNIIWLFVAFYGYTFVISNPGMDANRYKAWFMKYADNDLSFSQFINTFYTEETMIVDVVEPILSYLIASVTSNYKILFLVFGFVFGYFYSRNIWYLLERSSGPLAWQSILLIICFSLINPFWNINGFRFNTAVLVFIFGVLPYFVDGKSKSLWAVLLSPLFHFSFILPVVIFLIYKLLGNRIGLYIIFAFVTYFISEIDLLWIKEKLQYLPDVFEIRTGSYVNRGLLNIISDPRNWYAELYLQVIKIVLLLLATFIYLKEKKRILKYPNLESLLSFSFLFIGVVNIVSLVPSGLRFYVPVELTFIAFLFLYHQAENQHSSLKTYIKVASIFLIFFCVIMVRIGFDTISITTILGNPLIAGLISQDSALIELIK